MQGVKFPANHKITEAQKLFNNLDNSSRVTRYVMYVLEKDSDWANNTLTASISFKDFIAKLNDIKKSYPMLVHFASHYSTWRGLDSNTQKDIEDYISL